MDQIQEFSNGEITKINTEYSGELIIEKYYNEIITSIGSNACKYGKIKTLDISKTSITTIKGAAFTYCTSLTSIKLPETLVSMKVDTFKQCPITSIYLPSSLESFSGTFNQCSSLKSFIVSQNNPFLDAVNNIVYTKNHKCIIRGSCDVDFSKITYINELTEIKCYAFSGTKIEKFIAGPLLETLGDGVFEFCTNLSDVNLIRSKVTLITSFCFGDSIISHLTLPPKLKIIKYWAFRYCFITKLYIPSSITEIGQNAFSNQGGKLDIYYFGKKIISDSTIFSGCSIEPVIYVSYSYKSDKFANINVIKSPIDSMFMPQKPKCTNCRSHTSILSYIAIIILSK